MAAKHIFYIIANNYICNISLLVNVYMHISKIIIKKRNNQKQNFEGLVINLVALRFRILCVSFKDGYKII